MQNRLRACGLLVVLHLGLSGAAPGVAQDVSGPALDALLAAKKGESGFRLFPARYGADGEILAVQDPAGLEVHLTRSDDPGEELVYPCGSFFRPPAGSYLYWIQGEWRMSPYSGRAGSEGEASGAPGATTGLPVVEAGRVALPPEEIEGGRGLVLHLLHAGKYLVGDFPRWELSRRRPVGEVGDGLLMPAGTTIGALWDRKDRRYVALSRPFEVKGRKTVEATLDRPQGVAHLVVQLERLASTAGERDVEVVLRRDGTDLPPDLKILTAARAYAFWYDLPPGPAELRAEAPQGFLAPMPLHLAAGRIERVAEELKPSPALDVALELPAGDGRAQRGHRGDACKRAPPPRTPGGPRRGETAAQQPAAAV